LARWIGSQLGLKVVHLDRLWWDDASYVIRGPETVRARTLDTEAFRALQRDLVAAASWVIDGGLESLDLRLARADTIVFLDLPVWVCAWRVLRRRSGRSDYPPGVRESWRWKLFLLRWILWSYPRDRRHRIIKSIAAQRSHAEVLWLRSRREVREAKSRITSRGRR
jgi:adenylate kinase family enzyme